MLSLSSAGVMGQPPGGSSGPPHSFDVSSNLCFVPQFCEHNSDTFFSCLREWLRPEAGKIPRGCYSCSVFLSGKAQEAYCSLSVADSKVYALVKTAVQKNMT